MTDYSRDEAAEHQAIMLDAMKFMLAQGQMQDRYACIAHFVMKKLRQERGYDFQAAEAQRLRKRLAEIDRDVMLKG